MKVNVIFNKDNIIHHTLAMILSELWYLAYSSECSDQEAERRIKECISNTEKVMGEEFVSDALIEMGVGGDLNG